MRAALYMRVSTQRQAARGYSLETQRPHLLSVAQGHGYSVIAEYTDTVSGAKSDRLGLRSLLGAAQDVIFDVELLFDQDHLAHCDVLEWEVLKSTLREAGITLHTNTGLVDLNNEDDSFFRTS